VEISSRKAVSKITLPIPFGAHIVNKGVQFTIFSRHATRVWLMLFNNADSSHPAREIRLDPEEHRIGDIWHIFVPRVQAGQFYLYRMESDLPDPEGHYYDPQQWLLDPYAHAVTGPSRWGRSNGQPRGHHVKNGSAFPKCIVVDDTFDWSHDHFPNIPLRDSIIYEAHLRGFTNHSTSHTGNPGTYAGLIEKIPYLKKLGITTLELLPVHEFNEMEYHLENGTRKHLRNYWGYSTQNFFAPMGRYAASGVCGEQVREFKKLVRACHKAGIEVILDVVFNHTNEGNENGPTYSMRGIDNSVYYINDAKGLHATNYTGCGNTVSCNHPVVQDFILDCLRYWHTVMHVDGFRFDLASIMTRNRHGDVLPHPPVIEHIAEDPLLAGAKLIAEAWDAAGLYQVGSFPHKRWSEWNGRYRDDIREFWNTPNRNLRAFVTRLIGSPDLYAHNGQTPQKSINFITCHDGFTLHDLVSYNSKHNEANGEENRDGENHNRSCNYGTEGPTSDHRINNIRLQQMKNMIATLLLSQGVPMLLAGDEFARTQQGNNNTYCQDNPLSWIDWTLLTRNHELYSFVRKMIVFRLTHPSLRRKNFLNDKWDSVKRPDVLWHGPEGHPVDWDHSKTIACQLPARKNEIEDLFIIFNAEEKPRTYVLPEHDGQAPWHLAISTQMRPPAWRTLQKTIKVGERSTNIFRASRL
jgi:glycogen operon protein